MLVRDLRERYGKNFAAGHADTVTLREVNNRLDAASLNRVQGDLEKGQLDKVGAFRAGPSRGSAGSSILIPMHADATAISHVSIRLVLAELGHPLIQNRPSFVCPGCGPP